MATITLGELINTDITILRKMLKELNVETVGLDKKTIIKTLLQMEKNTNGLYIKFVPKR